jgi:hypothetical protein
VLDTAWTLILPALLLWTGLSARLRDWARAAGRKWFFVVAIYWVLFTIAMTAIDLPRTTTRASSASMRTASRTRRSVNGRATSGESGRHARHRCARLVGAVSAAGEESSPLVDLHERSRRAVHLLIVLVQPIWIDPLFNRFGPMQDKVARSADSRLADRAGIEGGRVFEVAKSEDTKTLNAYVNGFGAPSGSCCGTRSSRPLDAGSCSS